MFTQQQPYDSSAKDRSKPPGRIDPLKREDWNKLWEILVVCWSANPLDRPTASDLVARLHESAGRPFLRSSFLIADANLAEWLSTLTCFALSTHTDDNGRDFETLVHNVKNLIEIWQDTPASHVEANALTKRLDVRNIPASVCSNNMFIWICVLEIY